MAEGLAGKLARFFAKRSAGSLVLALISALAAFNALLDAFSLLAGFYAGFMSFSGGSIFSNAWLLLARVVAEVVIFVVALDLSERAARVSHK